MVLENLPLKQRGQDAFTHSQQLETKWFGAQMHHFLS